MCSTFVEKKKKRRLREPLENSELGSASLTEEQRAPAGGSVGDHPTDKDMWFEVEGHLTPISAHRKFISTRTQTPVSVSACTCRGNLWTPGA